jgi:hypothetical protein
VKSLGRCEDSRRPVATILAGRLTWASPTAPDANRRRPTIGCDRSVLVAIPSEAVCWQVTNGAAARRECGPGKCGTGTTFGTVIATAKTDGTATSAAAAAQLSVPTISTPVREMYSQTTSTCRAAVRVRVFRCRDVFTQAAAERPPGCQAAWPALRGCSSPDSRRSARLYRAVQLTRPERGRSGRSQEHQVAPGRSSRA